jgi:cytidylate kinase
MTTSKGNVFLKYMNERLQQPKNYKRDPGPVITVSRQYGCYGSSIAMKLCDASINETNQTWKWISKEVLDDASRHLKVDTEDISHIFGANEKSFWQDLKESLSSNKYTSDDNIKRTISKVVRSYAEQGHSIIVGRAGCIIAKDITRSFHIRLIAPFNWRMERIRERFKISREEAIKQVKEIDAKRDLFMAFFRGDKPDCEIFDVIFNRNSMRDDDIVKSVVDFVRNRNFFQD